MAIKLGKDCKLYVVGSSAGYANLAVVGNVKDLTLNQEASQADVSVRASLYKLSRSTLRNLTVSGQLEYDPTDTPTGKLVTAFNTGATVEAAALTGVLSTGAANDSAGVYGHWNVSQWNRSEALEDSVKIDFELTLATFLGLVTDGTTPLD